MLDLFAGSGGLGIELLSRGAARAHFVDSHPDSIALTRKNLQLTGLDSTSTLIMMDATKALKRFSAEGRLFDIILVDPPYADKVLTESVMQHLADLRLLTKNGVIVLETDSRYDVPVPDIFRLSGRKVYGDTALSFFESAD